MIKFLHYNTIKGYGKKVQSGILGKVYAKLKLLHEKNPAKYILIKKFTKTTQNCVCCKIDNKNTT